MKVVLLCGGVGKRMFPLTEDKFLLRFLGRTLLEHQIEGAKKAGLTEFVIIGNPSNIEAIQGVARGINGVSIDFAVQEKPLGMADALESAAQFLSEEPIIVVNANDVFADTAYSSLLEEHRRGAASCYILAFEVKDYFPGGYLVVNEKDEVERVIEKPGRGKEPSNLVNIVAHLHTQPRNFVEHTRKVTTSADDVYERALDEMSAQGYKIRAVRYRSFWASIKYPWHVFPVMEHFLGQGKRSISPTARVSERATIEGDVIMEDGVRVLENAVIRGPCYIGRNSVIGNNVLIRDRSHIGEGCVVGFATEIKHSYIGDNCWFHMNYVGDSILADNCLLGAGAVTANFRFDEGDIRVKIGDEPINTETDKLGAILGRGAKIGVNVTIMPGVKVGANSLIGPHLCLNRDVGPNKLLLASQRHRAIEKEV